MNAIEITNLSKSFRGMYAVDGLNMTVPVGAGFLNVIMCLAGGAIFAVGLGAISNVILDKTSLV